MKMTKDCLITFLAIACIATASVSASAAKLEGYISALSEEFDNWLQYRVILEKGFKYAPGNEKPTED